MKAYRIDLTSWTASFRYPNIISGYQPSLRVPPISTIGGLISAAAGQYMSPGGFEFAYIFRYQCSAVDLELIYQIGADGNPFKAKSNVIRREFLVFNQLSVYIREKQLAKCFHSPYYPLLLGRSVDLASVSSIDEIELKEVEALDLAGTAVPFSGHRLAAPIQALPTHFSEDIPRRNIGTQPFYLLDWQRRGTYKLQKNGWRDQELDADLFWYTPEMIPESD